MLKPLFIGFVALVAVIALVSIGYWYGFHSNNPTAVSFSPITFPSSQASPTLSGSPVASATPGASVQTSPVFGPVVSGFACPAHAPQGYDIALGSWNGDQAYRNPDEYLVDLKGDGAKELVRVYDQSIDVHASNHMYGERYAPVMVKVFSSSDASCQELYSFTAPQQTDGNGALWGSNELGEMSVVPRFFGDAKQAFIFQPISTGYGSGYASYLDILAWQAGSFQVIEGPNITELDIWKFSGADFPGETILVARGIWDSTPTNGGVLEGHFDPHRVHFESWAWADGQYVKTDLGTTQNKYSFSAPTPSTIDDIIRAEPSVLNPQ